MRCIDQIAERVVAVAQVLDRALGGHADLVELERGLHPGRQVADPLDAALPEHGDEKRAPHPVVDALRLAAAAQRRHACIAGASPRAL